MCLKAGKKQIFLKRQKFRFMVQVFCYKNVERQILNMADNRKDKRASIDW